MCGLPGSRGFFVAALLSLAGATALAAPATLRLAIAWEPVPHLVRVSSAALAMVGSFCLVGVVLYSTRSTRDAARLTRLHGAVLVVFVVVVALCLYMSGAPATATRTPTDANLGVTAFFVIRFGYTGAATIAFLVLIHRTSRLPETSSMNRVGFRLAMAATSIALIHAVWTLGVHLGVLRMPIDQDVAAVILGVALALLACGATALVWGPIVHAGLGQFRIVRARKALGRVWSELADLRAVTTTVTMHSVPASGYNRAVTDLHRYCVALRDVQRAARPYAHPAVTDWVVDAARRHGLSGTAARVITEAAELGTALDAGRAGAAPRTPAPDGMRPLMERRVRARRATDPPPPGLLTTPDLGAESAHLAAVGFALRHSRLVAEFRQRARADTATAHVEPDAAP